MIARVKDLLLAIAMLAAFAFGTRRSRCEAEAVARAASDTRVRTFRWLNPVWKPKPQSSGRTAAARGRGRSGYTDLQAQLANVVDNRRLGAPLRSLNPVGLGRAAVFGIGLILSIILAFVAAFIATYIGQVRARLSVRSED